MHGERQYERPLNRRSSRAAEVAEGSADPSASYSLAPF